MINTTGGVHINAITGINPIFGAINSIISLYPHNPLVNATYSVIMRTIPPIKELIK
ncbi:MAG: hypothetical protein ACTSPY_16540 [Candidatus Helarchaeota archaeon]